MHHQRRGDEGSSVRLRGDWFGSVPCTKQCVPMGAIQLLAIPWLDAVE